MHITFANYVQNFIRHSAVKVKSICRGKYWGSSTWIFSAKGWLIIYSAFVKYLRRNTIRVKQYISYLQTSTKLKFQLGQRLYCTLIEFGMPMKLVRLIKMCLIETYNRVWVGKHLFDMFLIRNGWNEEMLYCHCFSTLP
jgi:hypothetical protein